MIGESEDLATSLLSDADMNHDSKIDLDGKGTRFLDFFLYIWVNLVDFQSSYIWWAGYDHSK